VAQQRDPIDLIYDEFVADEKRKHGTKYEIVAAIVFKALLAEHKVVHDLRLSGPGKRTKHQIDVTVERRDGQRLRLIIECRHLFPTSGGRGSRSLRSATSPASSAIWSRPRG
jgi:hypothetical protein